jgi:hypothetical protein
MKFCEKNVLCEKGDEITRFDGTFKSQFVLKNPSNRIFDHLLFSLDSTFRVFEMAKGTCSNVGKH